VNFDRFVIGAILPVSAVAYYAAPFDVIMKLLVIPAALLGVLFPAFAATYQNGRSEAALLFDRALRFMVLAVFPPVLVIVAFAHEGLRFWLGPEFARQSAAVVRWLGIGVLVNAVGYVGFGVVQGTGRSDLTAKLHLTELPVYAVVLFVFTKAFGLTGVAMTWTLRAAVDAAVLSWLGWRALGRSVETPWRALATLGIALAALVLSSITDSAPVRLAIVGVGLFSFGGMAWFHLLRPDERHAARTSMSWIFGRVTSVLNPVR
ncbi:MAG: polysaccharide biosynthesis C-terminal domain-containing protein, partial [bacterium]